MSRAAVLTGVSATLTARHIDPIMDEGEHEHTWRVTAWYPGQPWIDGRSPREALLMVLGAFEGKVLPPELWSGEALAAALMHLLGNCIGIDLSRDEGFHVQVRA